MNIVKQDLKERIMSADAIELFRVLRCEKKADWQIYKPQINKRVHEFSIDQLQLFFILVFDVVLPENHPKYPPDAYYNELFEITIDLLIIAHNSGIDLLRFGCSELIKDIIKIRQAAYRNIIQEAQNQSGIKYAGKNWQRVRYGEEQRDWVADIQPCGDCGVVKGQFHVIGCDIEQCPVCNGQAISCQCK